MERVTVTLPADLVEKIDQLERNRSRFIAEAVEHELAQRRRDALRRSIQNPHSETTQLVDIGLSEWISDLPNDETLVDERRNASSVDRGPRVDEGIGVTLMASDPASP
jgi:metal-responsive CopG/Arc/MetJ family transcriptional regulator